MFERIVGLLPDFCEEFGNITEQTSLVGDLGMTSMDYYVFVNGLEEEFNVKIADEEVYTMLTVGDVMRCIEHKMA